MHPRSVNVDHDDHDYHDDDQATHYYHGTDDHPADNDQHPWEPLHWRERESNSLSYMNSRVLSFHGLADLPEPVLRR